MHLEFQQIKWEKKNIFFACFWQFFIAFPLFMPKSESLPLPLLSLKSNRSHLLLLLLTKERPRANISCRSLQKSNREWFTPVAHDKRATGVIRYFSREICSFSWAICSFSQANPISEFPILTSTRLLLWGFSAIPFIYYNTVLVSEVNTARYETKWKNLA